MMSSAKFATLPNSPLEQLHNYYERLVLDAIRARGMNLDEDAFVDVACVALNELPAKWQAFFHLRYHRSLVACPPFDNQTLHELTLQNDLIIEPL